MDAAMDYAMAQLAAAELDEDAGAGAIDYDIGSPQRPPRSEDNGTLSRI